MSIVRFINPVTGRVNGILTLETFPRRRGYEVIGVLQRPGVEPTFASHGRYPSKEAALQRVREIFQLMKRNPTTTYLRPGDILRTRYATGRTWWEVTELNTTLYPGKVLLFGYRWKPSTGATFGRKRFITSISEMGSLGPYYEFAGTRAELDAKVKR